MAPIAMIDEDPNWVDPNAVDPPAKRAAALLVGELITDAQTLVRKEVELAKAEVKAELNGVKKGALFGGIAAAIGLYLMFFVGMAITATLDLWMPAALAAWGTVILLIVIAAIAGLLAKKKFSSVSLAPTQAQESVKENVAWAKTALSSKKK